MRISLSNPDFRPYGPGRWGWDRTALKDYGPKVQQLSLNRAKAKAVSENRRVQDRVAA